MTQAVKHTEILQAAMGDNTSVKVVGSHRSKSQDLPILAAEGANVIVTNLSHNFYFYFLGIELKKPIPACFLYPISGLMGRYALSGHTDPENAPAITNFAKEYNNLTPIRKFGLEASTALQCASAIKYLEAVSKLPLDELLDIFFHKSYYGKIDGVDMNAVAGEAEGRFADILNLGYEKFAYYHFDVTNADSMFKKLTVHWFYSSTDCGSKPGSKLYIELQDGVPFPSLPVPGEHLCLVPTPEMQALSILQPIPLSSLAYHKDAYKLTQERKWHKELVNYNVMCKAPDQNKFVLHAPNGLDLGMSAFLLNHIVPGLYKKLSERLL